MNHRAAFCSFSCPDSWEPVAPLMWAAPVEKLARPHARLVEQWLLPARTTADVVAEIKMLWTAADPQMKLEHEAAMPPAGGVERWGAVVRMKDEFGQPARRLASLLVLGPAACLLTVDRPLEGSESLDRTANEIASSLQVEAAEVLAEARYAPVAPAEGDGSGLPLGEPRAVPTLCLSLAVPKGWEVQTPRPCEATLLGPGMSVQARRRVGETDDLRVWFGERLRELSSVPGARLRAWEKGKLGKADFAGLAFQESESGGTWGKPVVREVVTLGVAHEQLLEWRATATTAPRSQAAAALQQILKASPFLPPPDWETPVAEPWLPITLRGGWIAKGGGVYVKVHGGMMLLHASIQPLPAPLEKARPTIADVIDMVRTGKPLIDVFHEEEAVGKWRGLEAYRYALDALFGTLGNRSARGVAMQVAKELYSCRLMGAVRDEVHPLFLEILNRLAVPGMKEK
jgi:hypothetical protein